MVLGGWLLNNCGADLTDKKKPGSAQLDEEYDLEVKLSI
jgi:hypothetical protein